MRNIFLLALMLMCSNVVAGEIVGSVWTEMDEPLHIDPSATIAVEVGQAINVSNANFHARNFTEALQSKYPNAYFAQNGTEGAQYVISLAFKNSDKTIAGTKTQYSKTPSEWKCTDHGFGTKCSATEYERTASGSYPTESSYKGYILVAFVSVSEDLQNYRVRVNGNLGFELDSGMCNELEAFKVLSRNMVKHMRFDHPVDKKLSFASPWFAGCRND